jgi:hypothetical protein
VLCVRVPTPAERLGGAALVDGVLQVNRLYSCILKVFGVDSESSRSLTPGPREDIVIDPNENECKDGLPVHLMYDWTGANPGRRYVCCCEVNDNLYHF